MTVQFYRDLEEDISQVSPFQRIFTLFLCRLDCRIRTSYPSDDLPLNFTRDCRNVAAQMWEIKFNQPSLRNLRPQPVSATPDEPIDQSVQG